VINWFAVTLCVLFVCMFAHDIWVAYLNYKLKRAALSNHHGADKNDKQ